MKIEFEILISSLEKGAKTNSVELVSLKEKLTFDYPADYMDLMQKYNGVEGTLNNSHIAIWSVNEVIEINNQYLQEDRSFANRYFIFASNSGIFSYAFDKSNGSIFELDMMDDNYQIPCGNSIVSLLNFMAEKEL